MRVIFAGTPAIALPSLDAILASRHDVVAVLTRPDARAGRGRRLVPSPVAAAAAVSGIEVLKPERAKDAAFLERLTTLAPGCCPVVAYGALLSRPALEIPRHGWVNLHFSLLPAWRGAAPVQQAIMAGDDITGAATFEIVEELDAGPIYGMMTEPIRPTDTSGELLERLAIGGARLLVDTLDGIEDGRLRPRPQAADGASYASKILPSDARVVWSTSADRIDRLVRACTPAPGAWTTFRGARLKVFPISVRDDLNDLAPGQLTAGEDGVHVGTGSRPARLGDVQEQGRRRMPALEWARGARIAAGERLA